MATRIVSVLRRLPLRQVVYRYSKQRFAQRAIAITGSNKLNYASNKSRMYFRYVTPSIGRLKLFGNFVRKPFLVPRKYQAPKLTCPTNLFPGKFLGKGCSAVIVGVTDPNFESKIILKQPYIFDHGHIFENESGVLAKLSNHPNIIHFFGESTTDICQDPNFRTSCPDVEHYGLINSVILERMDSNLESLLKEVDLTIIDRVDVLSQILEAQIYMRKKSICHRDLKCPNILIKYATINPMFRHPLQFIVKVADFDSALDLNSITTKNLFHQGTPECTAPEILKNSLDTPDIARKLYAKSDIWSIGLMAYEIFGNPSPFKNISVNEYSTNDLPSLQSVPSVPSVIDKLVKCLLDPDPNSRYQSCIASDILQIFRMKAILSQGVYDLFKNLPINMFIGCCFFHQMNLSISRLVLNPNRLQFALNFVDE